jgi:prepilin-type N-terminal cleavage/methylation domain-containing protein
MRGLRTGQDGFTIVEVLIAVLILTFVIAASSALFVHGSDESLSAQRQSELISVADQQIETIRQEVKTDGFDQLAMSAVPASGSGATLSFDSNTPLDPNNFVSSAGGCGASNEGYDIESNYDDTSQGPASGVFPWASCADTGSAVAEPLEVLSGGFVTPQQTSIAVGSDTATVDTYVTDTYIGCNTSLGSCPVTSSGTVSGCTWPSGTTASTTCADARRVIVAVVLNNHGYSSEGRADVGPNSPVYVSTVFTNPEPSNSPSNPAGVTLGVQIG